MEGRSQLLRQPGLSDNTSLFDRPSLEIRQMGLVNPLSLIYLCHHLRYGKNVKKKPKLLTGGQTYV
jgi:hypothetical protein